MLYMSQHGTSNITFIVSYRILLYCFWRVLALLSNSVKLKKVMNKNKRKFYILKMHSFIYLLDVSILMTFSSYKFLNDHKISSVCKKSVGKEWNRTGRAAGGKRLLLHGNLGHPTLHSGITSTLSSGWRTSRTPCHP